MRANGARPGLRIQPKHVLRRKHTARNHRPWKAKRFRNVDDGVGRLVRVQADYERRAAHELRELRLLGRLACEGLGDVRELRRLRPRVREASELLCRELHRLSRVHHCRRHAPAVHELERERALAASHVHHTRPRPQSARPKLAAEPRREYRSSVAFARRSAPARGGAGWLALLSSVTARFSQPVLFFFSPALPRLLHLFRRVFFRKTALLVPNPYSQRVRMKNKTALAFLWASTGRLGSILTQALDVCALHAHACCLTLEQLP
mmetsp:Transcript_24323/g.79359  ORF Transcript_24323/g.79359 Transcript_24323/m.79359 type:complete len:264 (-) Transcript_24323:513-1304(-)